jgi:hypothetical protein
MSPVSVTPVNAGHEVKRFSAIQQVNSAISGFLICAFVFIMLPGQPQTDLMINFLNS